MFYKAAEGGKWKEKFVANGYEGMLELFQAGDVTSEVLKSFKQRECLVNKACSK